MATSSSEISEISQVFLWSQMDLRRCQIGKEISEDIQDVIHMLIYSPYYTYIYNVFSTTQNIVYFEFSVYINDIVFFKYSIYI